MLSSTQLSKYIALREESTHAGAFKTLQFSSFSTGLTKPCFYRVPFKITCLIVFCNPLDKCEGSYALYVDARKAAGGALDLL